MTKSNFFPTEYGWHELLDQPCERCKLLMHMADGQDLAFCPNCAIDKKNAYQGRTMLAVAKARHLKKRLKNAPEMPL